MRTRFTIVGITLAVALIAVAIAWRGERPRSDPPLQPAEGPADPLAPRSLEINGELDYLALSPDGKFIVATAYHRSRQKMDPGHRGVQLLSVKPDTESGKTFHRTIPYTAFPPTGMALPSEVAIAPNGRLVALAENHSSTLVNQDDPRVDTTVVSVWDTATGNQTATFTGSKAQQLYHVAFSPDGKQLAAGGALLNKTAQPEGGGVTVWDSSTGQVVWSDLSHKAVQTELAFSANGNFLAAADDDHMLLVWEASTGRLVRAIETRDYKLFSVSFSLNGQLVAGGGGDGAARVWDVATGHERHSLRGFRKSSNVQEPLFVRFLPNGNLLTAGAAEKDDGSLKIWDVQSGALVRTFANPNRSVWWLDITADGKTAVMASYAVGTWQREKNILFIPLTQ